MSSRKISKWEVFGVISSQTKLKDARTIAAHYIKAMERGSSALDETPTRLEQALIDAANEHLKTVPKDVSERSKKESLILAKPDKEYLAYLNNARERGFEVPEIYLIREQKILSRMG